MNKFASVNFNLDRLQSLREKSGFKKFFYTRSLSKIKYYVNCKQVNRPYTNSQNL